MLNWIIKFITAAVLSHAFFLWVGPHIVMSKLDKGLKRAQTEYRPECGERWVEGVIYSNPDCLSDVASSRRPNPDFIYTLIPYDLKKGNLLVSAPVPSDDRYWSIHAHNRNTDAFYKITNTEIDGNRFKFLVTRDRNLRSELSVAYASSNKGLILFRLTMKNFSEYSILDEFRRSTNRKYVEKL
tara:strand:+ start:123 stop:674 length:552 start_codon:yes stop_codon:yes gene_type:complete